MSTDCIIKELHRIKKNETELVGGKALNLGILIKNGFNVPPGFVITTEAYSSFIDENDLNSYISKILEEYSPETSSKLIKTKILDLSLPKDVEECIKDSYESLGLSSVAVRSSAPGEDLQDASFAGQMESYLNICNINDVLEKVKECYASLWTSRAISYREMKDTKNNVVTIAVIIEMMVDPVSAGVLFTIDPVSGNKQIVIESNYGYGETVVSGKVAPDRFIVKLNPSLAITVREIGTKELKAERGLNGGIVLVEPNLDDRQNASLSDNQILGLAETGARVEALYNLPQDIEWAITEDHQIYILQSRPITTNNSSGEKTTSWTRGYSDDYWNDNVTPLFFELLGDHITEYVNIELNEILGYSKPGDAQMDQLLKLHKAHAYFNLEVLKRKVEYEIPGFLRNNDVLNYFPEGEGLYGKDTMKKLPFRLSKRLMVEYRIRTRDPDGASTRTADAYDKWTQEIMEPFWNDFDARMRKLENRPLKEYLSFAGELNNLMIGHYRLVRYGIPVHNIGMNLMSQYLLNRFLGAKEAALVYPVLVSGLKHSTRDTNDRLFELAEYIRQSPNLRMYVLDIDSKTILPSLSELGETEFNKLFSEFLKDYGCRGFTREPYYPRWGEAPEYVFDILKSLITDERSDLLAVEEKNIAERRRVEEELQKTIRSQRYGDIKLKLVKTVIGIARRYIIFREEQRYNLDKWITMNRVLYLKIGELLTLKGHLREPSDIFFLGKQEIKALDVNKPEDVKELIKHRREEFYRYENVTPPKFIEGDREYNDPYPPSARNYKGIPASQGILTGPVRVLKNINDIWRVKAGEILVVPRTDPGWTPIFSKIGGLITETGGVLSHGAVVSREYGVPAVTNISNACRIFKTGQIVTINGATGSVSMDD